MVKETKEVKEPLKQPKEPVKEKDEPAEKSEQAKVAPPKKQRPKTARADEQTVPKPQTADAGGDKGDHSGANEIFMAMKQAREGKPTDQDNQTED